MELTMTNLYKQTLTPEKPMNQYIQNQYGISLHSFIKDTEYIIDCTNYFFHKIHFYSIKLSPKLLPGRWWIGSYSIFKNTSTNSSKYHSPGNHFLSKDDTENEILCLIVDNCGDCYLYQNVNTWKPPNSNCLNQQWNTIIENHSSSTYSFPDIYIDEFQKELIECFDKELSIVYLIEYIQRMCESVRVYYLQKLQLENYEKEIKLLQKQLEIEKQKQTQKQTQKEKEVFEKCSREIIHIPVTKIDIDTDNELPEWANNLLES
jgi:hypothetical protein